MFSYRYCLRLSSHSPPSVNAAIAASTANTFGSATSSVFRPLHILCLRNLSGTTIAAVCIPAMLKVFVGAIQVTLISLHVSDAVANGTYSFPGSVRSQCISSEMTVTPYFAHSSPTWASVSLSQIFPAGFCGLQSIMRLVCGSASFASRSSKSMAYPSPSYFRGLSNIFRPLLYIELKKIL